MNDKEVFTPASVIDPIVFTKIVEAPNNLWYLFAV